MASLLPYIPVFFKEAGLTADAAAVLYGFMTFMGAGLRPLFGWIADKLHRHKLVLMICCLLTGPLHALMLQVPHQTNSVHVHDLGVTIKCRSNLTQFQFCPTDFLDSMNCEMVKGSSSLSETSPNPLQNVTKCMLTCTVGHDSDICINRN